MARIGDEVSARGISGRVEVIVRKGERYRAPALGDRRWASDSFAVVRDHNGGSHYVELAEIGR
jgi:hypothetical protein